MPKRHPWQTELDFAAVICKHLGCTLQLSENDYEIAVVKTDGVQLLIYPHTNSNRQRSARLRDNGSKDKAKARRIMLAMKDGVGLPEDTRWRVSTYNMFYAKKLPGSSAMATQLRGDHDPA